MKIINNFRQLLKRKFDAISNQSFKKNLLNALPFWLGSIITGLVAVLYAKLFSWAEMGTQFMYAHFGIWLLLITPITFFVAWYLVHQFSPYARGSGIPQVSAAIELTTPNHSYKVNKLLSIRIIVVKIISSLVMVLGGGAIGREGPTIQIAASIFKRINDLLPQWYPKISRRNMIVTGAAAGLASAFNTPLGGIVFAIEELTKTHFNFFKSALLTGVIIAGMTALSLLGPYLYLGYPKLNDFSLWMICAVLPLAVITGLGGSGMGKIILFAFKKKRNLKSKMSQVIYVLICGLVIATLAIWVNKSVLGSGKELMETTLFSSNKTMVWYMPILRTIGPIISFTTGAAGGIFAPSLSAGASIGAVLSGWFHLSETETNLMMLCGMVGFLTGITRSPFTSSILVIEMTNNHNIIFYLMLTALAANLVANFISRHSFYDHLNDQYVHDIHQSEWQKNDSLLKE